MLASEIKGPKKGRPRGRLYWQLKAGVRNEALDCENYALHSARRLKINLMTEAQWSAIEQRLRQPDLVGVAAQGNSPQPVRTLPSAEHPGSEPPAPASRRDKIAEQFKSDFADTGGTNGNNITPY
ncbi:MAG: terminase gpA endonuclease subunit [Actinomycetota bacterium]